MHREPLRNNFSPSRRHSRQTGPRYLATASLLRSSLFVKRPERLCAINESRSTCLSDPSPLRRPTSVVGNGRDITDQIDPKTSPLQRADRRLTSRTRSIHIDINLPHPMLHRLPCRGFPGPLSSKRRALARSLEPLIARARPHDCVAAHISDGDNRVVERGLNVGDPALDRLPFLFLPFLDAHAKLLLCTCAGSVRHRPRW